MPPVRRAGRCIRQALCGGWRVAPQEVRAYRVASWLNDRHDAWDGRQSLEPVGLRHRPGLWAVTAGSCGVTLGCGGEIGQVIGIVPGTFDWWDLWISAAAAVLAIWLGRYWPRRQMNKAPLSMNP